MCSIPKFPDEMKREKDEIPDDWNAENEIYQKKTCVVMGCEEAVPRAVRPSVVCKADRSG